MTTISVLGGTGYAGAFIVSEAAARGHQVTAWSRNAPATPVDGVDYKQGTFTDPAVVDEAVTGADVVIATLSPRGELEGEGTLAGVYAAVEAAAVKAGARLGIVGGFGSHRAAPGAPRFAWGEEFPAEYAPEARELVAVLESLQAGEPEGLSWFFVSPAQVFGAFAPGERTGAYRSYGEVPEFDANGQSVISGADFAIAVIDEVEKAAHVNEHFGVAN